MDSLVGDFSHFSLINLADLIYAYTGFKLLESTGGFGDFYRLLADVVGAAHHRWDRWDGDPPFHPSTEEFDHA